MKEKAYKPQFYKHLSWNQFLDIIPKRRRDWAGERVSQLEKVKLYEHPEDYKDMMYSLAIPERNPIYPTFRAETGQWRHPSFDVLIPSATPEDVTTAAEWDHLLLLLFEGDNGATTWSEVLPTTYTELFHPLNTMLDSAQYVHGATSLKLAPRVGGAYVRWAIPPIGSAFTWSGHVRFDSLPVRRTSGALAEIMFAVINDPGEGVSKLFGIYNNNADNQVYIHCYAGVSKYDVLLGSSLSINTWHHLAIVCQGREFRYYIDGNLFYTLISDDTDEYPFLGKTQFSNEITNCADGLNVWVDSEEIVDYARWSSNFIPPQNAPALEVVTV